MQTPLQVTFRDMEHSDAVEARVREKADKLHRYYDRIMGCRVVIEMPQRHKHQGKLHSVRIDLTVPGAELVANHARDEDVYVAIREAFGAITRQLEDFARRQRGEVKAHATPGER
jgi:ribosomal subunit interface protein